MISHLNPLGTGSATQEGAIRPKADRDILPALTGQDLSELAQFGKIYLFETVSSTHEIAKSLVDRKEPSLVIALVQTHGRGRFHRDWYSEKGGLYLSYLIFPDFSAKPKIAQLTLLASLSVAHSLESLIGNKIEMRWPNDLLLAGKKVGGLLCATKGPGLIISIGINLNQSSFPDFLPNATSLFLVTKQSFEIGKVLKIILGSLTNFYNDFLAGKFTDFLPELKKRQVLINQRIRAELWLRRIEGTVIDLDDAGRLVLRTDPGLLVIISAGKVHRIRNV